MTDQDAKERLTELLDRYTLGSVLHLLAEVCRESAESARQDGDALGAERFEVVEHALFVVGLGVDAANPS